MRKLGNGTRNWKPGTTLVFHLAFWAVVYLILVRHFSISSELKGIDYLFAALFQAAVMVPVYVNLILLVPYLFKRKKYVLYLLGLGLNAALFLGVHWFIFEKLTAWFFSDYYIIGYYDVALLLLYYLVFVGITTLIQLSRSWFEVVGQERRIQRLEVEKAQTELKALKAQINPHFLFNSLNSLYALSLRKADELPEVTLKLADVLRYMIYEAQETFVPLQKEVNFLQKYLDLQRLRLQPQTRVEFMVEGELANYQVAPLIFIVLVENAFKHGAKAAGEAPYVHLKLTTKDDSIHFVIENSKGKTDFVKDTEASGLGLENVRQRLALIYPEHVFEVEDEEEVFRVRVEIRKLGN
jgi:two-component sensor histidine kinase